MNKKVSHPFSACVNLGLNRGYSDQLITEEEVIRFIQEYQKVLVDTKNIYLSCSISKSKVILIGQAEPHLKIEFINYPKFEISLNLLKNVILNFTEELMIKFNQNRIVITFHDQTIMLEQTSKIDPKIS